MQNNYYSQYAEKNVGCMQNMQKQIFTKKYAHNIQNNMQNNISNMQNMTKNKQSSMHIICQKKKAENMQNMHQNMQKMSKQ